MKTRAVIKRIKRAAEAAGLDFEEFQRTNHTGIRVGSKKTTIGRHVETPDLMAQTIYKQLEEVLGKDWWR